MNKERLDLLKNYIEFGESPLLVQNIYSNFSSFYATI